jgi:hypothetical protein
MRLSRKLKTCSKKETVRFNEIDNPAPFCEDAEDLHVIPMAWSQIVEIAQMEKLPPQNDVKVYE